MAKIIFISVFESCSDVIKNSRVVNIQKQFRDVETILVSTDFNHGNKSYISKDRNTECNIKRIHVPQYSKNLSIKRIWSHLVFAYKLKKYLSALKENPSLVYCAMPTSSAAYVAGLYCKKKKIPFVIDVIDLWPDSLLPISKHKNLVNIAVAPWKWISHKAYAKADYISAESEKYMHVAKSYNARAFSSYTYLGVDMNRTNHLIEESSLSLTKKEGEIWIAYGGSLGFSYDFETILHAIKYIHDKGVNYKMLFIGDGEKKPYIDNYKNQYNLNIEITGRVTYSDFLKYLSYSDIAINSFKEKTLVVHSYKFNDYVSTKNFILNNLNGETAAMIDKYRIGKNFDSTNLNEVLYNSCLNYSNDVRNEISSNLNRLIEDQLDSDLIYKRMVDDINNKLAFTNV